MPSHQRRSTCFAVLVEVADAESHLIAAHRNLECYMGQQEEAVNLLRTHLLFGPVASSTQGPAAPRVPQELHSSEMFQSTRVGVASRCDEPEWGRECLKKFMVEDRRCAAACVMSVEWWREIRSRSEVSCYEGG